MVSQFIPKMLLIHSQHVTHSFPTCSKSSSFIPDMLLILSRCFCSFISDKFLTHSRRQVPHSFPTCSSFIPNMLLIHSRQGTHSFLTAGGKHMRITHIRPKNYCLSQTVLKLLRGGSLFNNSCFC
jgi:hypothetical protein